MSKSKHPFPKTVTISGRKFSVVFRKMESYWGYVNYETNELVLDSQIQPGFALLWVLAHEVLHVLTDRVGKDNIAYLTMDHAFMDSVAKEIAGAAYDFGFRHLDEIEDSEHE